MNWMRPTDSFYGKYAPIFSNLFEVLYLCVTCAAPAVAFATGGATLSALTGLSYLFCTLLIGSVVNAILMRMVVLGTMTVYPDPEMSRQSVPTVFMVQKVAAFLVDRLINFIIIYCIEQQSGGIVWRD